MNAAPFNPTQTLFKYPRTRHIAGSGLQKGDGDLQTVALPLLQNRFLVVEEKVDGANAGISFDENGQMLLQCRGHYLTGGSGEAQFSLFKPWAQAHRFWLHQTLSTRFVLFGEWLQAKHTVFYDALPHYFMEFDIWDSQTSTFLSTPERQKILHNGPVVSVPVLFAGQIKTRKPLELIRPSLYKTANWREVLRQTAQNAGCDPDFVLARETDNSDLSEGLYIKWEENGRVVERYKWVRPDFISAILNSGTHWRERPLLQNGLAAAAGGVVGLFGAKP